MLVPCERLGAQCWRVWGVSGALAVFSMEHRTRWGQWSPSSCPGVGGLEYRPTSPRKASTKQREALGNKLWLKSSLPQGVQPAGTSHVWTPKTSADVLPQNPEVARSSRWTPTRWCQTCVKGAGCPARPREEVPHFPYSPAQIFACFIFFGCCFVLFWCGCFCLVFFWS